MAAPTRAARFAAPGCCFHRCYKSISRFPRIGNMKDSTILVLGGPKSGKTHYGAQLAIRLTKKTSSVKFFEQPENLSLFEEPMECLGRGRLAKHTPVAVSKDVVLPIELADGNRARVV